MWLGKLRLDAKQSYIGGISQYFVSGQTAPSRLLSYIRACSGGRRAQICWLVGVDRPFWITNVSFVVRIMSKNARLTGNNVDVMLCGWSD
jgi:hypothetical protein